MLNALIFDVDGTLADTESAHRAAFNEAFAQVGRDWVWDEALYTQLLAVSGGKERILHYWQQIQPDLQQINSARVRDAVNNMHALKTVAYERAVQDGAVQLRPGVLSLMELADQEGLRLAIATTTSPANISALLRTAIGPDWAHYFPVIEDASTAPTKKPHPQVYWQTLKRLQLPASECLALEDSANGLQAAIQAGLPTVITPNNFTAGHDFTGALRILPSLLGVRVAQLREWHGSGPAMQATGAGQTDNYRETPHAFVQAVHAHPIPD